MHLLVQQLGQLLDLHLAVDGLLPLHVLLALEVEGAVDGEPVQLAALELVVDVALDACQVSQLALLDVDEELHVVPNHMVLLLVLLEAILLPVEDVPLDAADEAGTVLVLLDALLLLSDLRELVDNNSPNNLIHDDLDDEEVAEVDQHIPERNGGVVVGEVVSIIQSNESSILLESDAQGEHEAVVESAAVHGVIPAAVVEVEDGGQDIGENGIDEQHDAQLVHGFLDGLQDDEKGLASPEELEHQHQRVEEGIEYAQNCQQHGEEVVQIV